MLDSNNDIKKATLNHNITMFFYLKGHFSLKSPTANVSPRAEVMSL